MTDEQVDFGITHNDHMGTEAWRCETVHQIETGQIPNMLPPELTTDEVDYMLRSSRVDAPWVIIWLLATLDAVPMAILIAGS